METQLYLRYPNQRAGEKSFSRRFESFKRYGPAEPRDYRCSYCGASTEFEDGYLVCHDCGGVDSIFKELFLYESAA